jgi:hypothetical protein
VLGNARFKSGRLPFALLPTPGYSEFYIQIKKTSFGNIIVGIAEKSIDQSLETNQVNNG